MTPDITQNSPVDEIITTTNNNNSNNNSSIYPSDNQFDALVDTSSTSSNNASSHTEANAMSTDDNSISTMGSTTDDTSCLVSLETLTDNMETIEPGVTTPNSKPTYTDAVLFQEAMGNAVAGLAVCNQPFGFSHLVDTTKRFWKRSNTAPNEMPKPPTPLVGDQRRSKIERTIYAEDLKIHTQAVHMKSLGFKLLTTTFPNCLDLKATSLGYPPDFHPKDALACVLGDTTSKSEQDKEFRGFQKDLLNPHYRHDPKTNSVDKFFKSIQKLKEKQDIVATHPEAGFTYVQLIHNAQTQVYEGVGGRKDLVHDIKEEWDKEQLKLQSQGKSQDEIWESFKTYCKKELNRLDIQGFITKKSESARSVISPEQATVDTEVDHKFSGIMNQLDALTEQNAALTEQNAHLASAAMSVISNDQHRAFNATTIPSYIQTDPTAGNASAMGSDAHTDAQCKRMLNELQISMGEKLDSANARNQELEAIIRNMNAGANTIATSNSTQSGFQRQNQHRDNSSMKKDAQGRKWHQVKFHCSKHGFNTSHSNENCNSKHMNKGHPWTPGATLGNTKGGSNANADKCNYWFEPRSKQCSPQPPN